MIKKTFGWLLIFEAIFMTLPLITAVIYKESEFKYFLISIGICILVGGLFLIGKPKSTTLYSREGVVIVAASWILLSLFGAVPFYISGAIPSYIDAFFETVSGFTTTGATILGEIESLPRSILLWRSFTHWIGGMGVLVFIMAFLPLSGGHNMHIMKAESPGPSVGKLVPKVKTTALILYLIYIALSFAEFIALLIAKMNVFDALNTTFATAGTGGFGIRNDSMNSYSPTIQAIVTAFMLIFSINFNSYYFLIRGKLKEVFTAEVRTFILIVIGATGLIALNIYGMFDSIGEALHHSIFSVASIISTTGFGTVDFDLWPTFSKCIIILLMFCGACAGSTGGGMKVSRFIILFKNAKRETRKLIHPKKVESISVDGRIVEESVVKTTSAYFFFFAIVMVISTLTVSLDGHSLTTGLTAVITSMNNVGPGLELVGPTQNFGFFSPLTKLVLCFDMLVGRLELFPVLLLLSPATRKK